MIRLIHRAKYVLADSDLLLQNSAVHVSEPGRISRIEPWQCQSSRLQAEVVDWGNAIILPGLVNAHSHLELTRLHGRVDHCGSFTNWLSRLVAARRTWTIEDYRMSVRKGAQLALSSGTTLVGDISASGISVEVLKSEDFRKVVFEEVIALRPEDASRETNLLADRLDRIPANPLLSTGVSPHAPYSVSGELFAQASRLAGERSIPLAIHLAETRSELEFLQFGTGEFRDFLQNLGALPSGWKAPQKDPVNYLDGLGVLQRAPLIIHGNYLDNEAMAKILANRCSVVFCPRSHAFFGFDRHPVREMLDLGINVALGTDSLASNDSLSMLDEMRFLFGARKDLNCREIFRMGTVNGASALGLGGSLGRLQCGYWADMTVLRLSEHTQSRNVEAQILEGAGECEATIIAGRIAWRASEEAGGPRLGMAAGR